MMTDRVPQAVLTADCVASDQLFWHWRESLAPFFDSVPLVDPTDPARHPASRQYHLGNFLLADTQFARQKFVRNAAWNRAHDDADHILLQSFIRGSNTVSNGNRVFTQDAHCVTAVHLGHEVNATSTDADVISLILPREWLAEVVPNLKDACGAVFAPGSMAARLMTDFMISLRRRLPEATTADIPVITDSLVGLLNALVVRQDPNAEDARTGILAALHRHIVDNLSDPALGVDTLCARFRLSRATLFRLFKPQGGVQSYIQQQRLLACVKALSSPQSFRRPIYDVALDCGFTNASHLSTLFRRHFGMSPREVRHVAMEQARLGGPPAPARDWRATPDVEVMQHWAMTLKNDRRPPSGLNTGDTAGAAGAGGAAVLRR